MVYPRTGCKTCTGTRSKKTRIAVGTDFRCSRIPLFCQSRHGCFCRHRVLVDVVGFLSMPLGMLPVSHINDVVLSRVWGLTRLRPFHSICFIVVRLTVENSDIDSNCQWRTRHRRFSRGAGAGYSPVDNSKSLSYGYMLFDEFGQNGVTTDPDHFLNLQLPIYLAPSAVQIV